MKNISKRLKNPFRFSAYMRLLSLLNVLNFVVIILNKMQNDSELLKIIAKNIVKLRKQKKLSQEDLAFKSGVNSTYLGYVENAKHNISILKLEDIAKALEVDLVFLLTLDEEK